MRSNTHIPFRRTTTRRIRSQFSFHSSPTAFHHQTNSRQTQTQTYSWALFKGNTWTWWLWVIRSLQQKYKQPWWWPAPTLSVSLKYYLNLCSVQDTLAPNQTEREGSHTFISPKFVGFCTTHILFLLSLGSQLCNLFPGRSPHTVDVLRKSFRQRAF